ncbi:4-coumarate--CoA ligase [Pseudoroseomonas cervicalis]|uniref:4-coumarate--CoA ligase n=1 Tax=Teichococcus cervicalis TaxID=204525 RepID=UPI0022F19832|nr:4-coumarate--CoA ligase [Pseudoroseomonas cervicalis]WBV43493.1 4-coumarate--CoA ligase [Pseudoroseomonas cervicalis]
MLPTLSRAAILRVLRSLLAAELASLSRRQIAPATAAGWGEDLALGAEGLALDSLERVGVATAINRLFHIHEVGVEDMLLSLHRLGEWAELVERVLQEGTSGLTFYSSGSTGAPHGHTHAEAALAAETAFWAARFAGCRRIVHLVPAHHIYGFLFAAALPEALGVPVADGRALSPAALRQALEPGSLLVGFPLGFRRLLGELGRLPPGVQATSSTGPLPVALHRALLEAGMEAVHVIYGSSETAGIGVSAAPDDPFTLLPRWRPGGAGEAASLVEVATGAEWPLPDRVAWLPDGRFQLQGRKDEAVQVGGVNVYPAEVARRLEQQPGVAACAVRLDTTLPEPRLKAFIVPAGQADLAALSEALDLWARHHLAAPSRPVHFSFGPALPLSPLGKPADWVA